MLKCLFHFFQFVLKDTAGRPVHVRNAAKDRTIPQTQSWMRFPIESAWTAEMEKRH